MNISFDAKKLRGPLRLCKSIIGDVKLPSPIACVLAETADDRLLIHASDLGRAVTFTVPAQVHEAGRVAIEAAFLNDIVERTGDCLMTLSNNKDETRLRFGKSDYKLKSGPADSYPILPTAPGLDGWGGVLKQRDLKRALRETIFATGGSRERWKLLFFMFQEERLELLGTNTLRLSVSRIGNPESNWRAGTGATNAAWLTDAMRLLSDAPEAEVAVTGDDRRLMLAFDGVTYSFPLSNDEPPRYEAVLDWPKSARVLLFNRCNMMEGVVRILAMQESRVKFVVKPDLLRLRAESQLYGNGVEELEAAWDGPCQHFYLNGRDLLQYLQSLDAKTIAARPVGHSAHLSASDSDGSYRHVLQMYKD